MFSRITVSDVPASEEVQIAFTLLKPEGWEVTRDDVSIAIGPVERSDVGFALLMPHAETDGAESLLGQPAGLVDYLQELFPELVERDWANDEDEMCPYELRFFHGKIDGVGGRVIVLGTSVQVEDVNFALVGFAQDEIFHRLRAVFRTMVASFQPVVTADR